ncbi:MerR family transcriptional regulator [Candidatus Stoquefichus massiliensis]|uniref:MerR family transcriptional regulator n=1 Tax=Candidatus Stoquefichus massiliensis TaxID=1470350 RepID=UPI00048916C3|nr:MerR family transcriptional regulator [Candidatus Stoquefichus massiliensis]
MTIKEVSEKFHISADTLRYYEKIGLIEPVRRNANGIRNYQESDINRIEFLRCMRLSGLSIQMLSQYLELAAEGDQTIHQRKDILLQQREEILAKMRELQETLDHLNHKIDIYDEKLSQKII